MKDNTVSLVSFYSRGILTYDIGEEGWIFLVVQGVLEDTDFPTGSKNNSCQRWRDAD